MDISIPSSFSCIEEERNFWKEKCMNYSNKNQQLHQELEEFTEGSQQLEAELELTIEQKEKTIKQLKLSINQLQIDNESLRNRLNIYEIERETFEKKYNNLHNEWETFKIYIRELEQKNDDLERAHRNVTESLAGFEQMLEQAYEKNALLENEVDEKELLQIKLQRLMDETRDLKQELNIKTITKTSSTDTSNSLIEPLPIVVSTTASLSIATTVTTTKNNLPNRKSLLHNSVKHSANENLMTPSSNVTAINIVTDLLRKINAMEARLRAAREALPPPKHFPPESIPVTTTQQTQ